MGGQQQHAMDKPSSYQIRVAGRLALFLIENLCMDGVVKFESDDEEPVSLLQVQVVDQAHLLGVINTLYNNGYAVLSVEQCPSEDHAAQQDETGQQIQ